MQLVFFVHNQHPAQGQRESLDGEDNTRITAPQHVWTVVNFEEQKNCARFAMYIRRAKTIRKDYPASWPCRFVRSLTRRKQTEIQPPKMGSSRGPYWPRSGSVICGPSSRSTRM